MDDPVDDLVVEPDPDGAGPEAVADLEETLVRRRHLAEQGDPVLAREAAAGAVEDALPRAHRLVVRRAAETVGHVWLERTREGDDLHVLDLCLVDAELGPLVRAEVATRARAEGHRRLTVAVPPGDLVHLGFVEGGGFVATSTQLALDLSGGGPTEPDGLTLGPMTADGYDRWQAHQLETYAAARVRAGETPEQARAVARRQAVELLPEGRETPGQHLLAGVADGVEVGTVWVSTRRPMAWVCDVAVAEEHRRRGHGAALMRAAAAWAAERGAHAVGLNVFADNHGARTLYDRLGYHVTETFAALELGPGR